MAVISCFTDDYCWPWVTDFNQVRVKNKCGMSALINLLGLGESLCAVILAESGCSVQVQNN